MTVRSYGADQAGWVAESRLPNGWPIQWHFSAGSQSFSFESPADRPRMELQNVLISNTSLILVVSVIIVHFDFYQHHQLFTVHQSKSVHLQVL